MSIQDKFTFCRNFTKRHEGGYVDNPHDAGGATMRGITLQTLANFRGVPVTKDDVRNLTDEEAGEIYKKSYYDPAMCSFLPNQIACVVFDAAINSGVHRSILFLQAALGIEQDGNIGQQTINAANNCPLIKTAQAALQWRLSFLKSLPTWEFFGNGWSARISDLYKYILTA